MKISEVVKIWMDRWTVSRSIGPIADISHNSDKADARLMDLLVNRRKTNTPVDIERRRIKRDRRN